MRIVVLTGLSGSGKSTAIRALEDVGYYAIDNLPVSFLDKLEELLDQELAIGDRLALVMDARSERPALAEGEGSQLGEVPKALERMRSAGHDVDLVFLDAADEILERRYSETRRRHPMSGVGVKAGISAERALLGPLRSAATRGIDTSGMSVHDLKREIQHAFSGGLGTGDGLSITVMSFGFKHGVPTEADVVLDVRFLPNPYFVDELRPLTGEDDEVAHYVLDRPESKRFLEHLHGLLDFILPQYEQEGKVYLTVALGCTGGRHRSVAMVRALAAWLRGKGRRVQIRHRDVSR